MHRDEPWASRSGAQFPPGSKHPHFPGIVRIRELQPERSFVQGTGVALPDDAQPLRHHFVGQLNLENRSRGYREACANSGAALIDRDHFRAIEKLPSPSVLAEKDDRDARRQPFEASAVFRHLGRGLGIRWRGVQGRFFALSNAHAFSTGQWWLLADKSARVDKR